MTSLERLRDLIVRLRAECPWDRAQDARSMRPYLLEEAHELVEAIDAGDEARMREELGDLLFLVFFQARLAEERGAWDIEAAARSIVDKMVERHPHVFAGAAAPEAGSDAAWEARKAAKRGSRIDGVPSALPALLRAHRVGEKVGDVGFDWPDLAGVLAKVDEERAELQAALDGGDTEAARREYGDLLLACASVGRFLGVSGEDALREANARFEGRFRAVERKAAAAGIPLHAAGLDRLERWWQEAKAEADAPPGVPA